MKQLVILSGKGGTGKTSLVAAFAHIAREGDAPLKVVLGDADVDAANLGLVLKPVELEKHDFIGGSVAEIDGQLCQLCGNCEQACRFDAVVSPVISAQPVLNAGKATNTYWVDPIACEGCASCVYQCPEDAIRMKPQIAGQWYLSDTPYGPLYHANLYPGQENSGKLVTLVKQQARLMALDTNYPLVLVDGPPGIGCPVISAAAGADLLLIVAEPTVSGIHDLERILQTAAYFELAVVVCINKADIYPDGTSQIETYCLDAQIEIAGKIPYDDAVMLAMLRGEPVTVFNPGAPASLELVKTWQRITGLMDLQPTAPCKGEMK